MSRLRNIFVAHDVPYPASARKSDLVLLFEQYIRPIQTHLMSPEQRIRPKNLGLNTKSPSLEKRREHRRSKSSNRSYASNSSPVVESHSAAETSTSPSRSATKFVGRSVCPSEALPVTLKDQEPDLAQIKTRKGSSSLLLPMIGTTKQEKQPRLVHQSRRNNDKSLVNTRAWEGQGHPEARSGVISRFQRWCLALIIFAIILGLTMNLWQGLLAPSFCVTKKQDARPRQNDKLAGSLSSRFLHNWCFDCPKHAKCLENNDIVCDPGYIARSSFWSFGGRLPVPGDCKPDSIRAKKVASVTNRALAILRDRKARQECAALTWTRGETPTAALAFDDLKDSMSRERKRGIGEDEFNQLWHLAWKDILSQKDIKIDSAR